MERKEGIFKEEGVVVAHLETKMRTRRKMLMWVLAKTKGTRVSTTLMIKTLEIREEEVENMDKVQEEGASMLPIFIAMKKVIISLNSLNAQEG